MKILKIWQDDYPWDVRVEKISNALIDDGHEVHLLCSNKGGLKVRENYKGIEIHRMRPFANDALNKICSMPAFFNPFWFFTVKKIVNQEGIDLVLVRDLPLVLSALPVARTCGIPIVFDMAENYPSMWKEHVDKRGLKSINHILKNPLLATLIEDYVIKKVDHLIVVVEESRDRLMIKGLSRDRISVVSNTPDLGIFSAHDLPEKGENGTVLLYVGYVNGGRGLDTAIKAVPLLKERIGDLRLVIAGGGEYLEELRRLARDLDVERYVDFLGWVDSRLVPSYIYGSDICIVPHDATDFVNSTIPNKLFDYMACRKPVIVSDAVPLRRIVNEADCGEVFVSRDPDDFAEKVICLQDSSVRMKKGMNGYMKVQSKYNWEYDSNILKGLIKKISIN